MSLNETNLKLPEEFTSLERICLTANGNLQRILSSWFNKTIEIKIIKSMLVSSHKSNNLVYGSTILRKYDREVNLMCDGVILCNAKSNIILNDEEIIDLIENQGVGIGQLFREYTLKISGVECNIKEVFPNNIFENDWLLNNNYKVVEDEQDIKIWNFI
ncbi:12179_t:CDS:2 [Entrophospora sp. SA101]|nr:7346_t:CDS:2 [Entrophospora sp. SA101]CAJ0638051.1 11196_t:CDS:2 [Entrophospora sp. SA101]CAJ0768428.1 12179_t:CDS:2 [Entrophospora sp. SA101]CAJ0835041.1 4358_t:CDS:2 [Entrophospora sp. SA101]CAJ0845712.1 12265_t:CDS:2 [Entrophospora sp. SA101]